MTIAMTADDIESYLEREFPQIHLGGKTFHVEEVGPMMARMRMDYHERHLRPGGTISGPSMMTLGDLALFVAILAQCGPVSLAVTTNLAFNFLRRPGPAPVIAECRLFRVGRKLAVGEVSMWSKGDAEFVCHATGTYALPSRK
jgi:uncharacterized protein (TIGR00369 family)